MAHFSPAHAWPWDSRRKAADKARTEWVKILAYVLHEVVEEPSLRLRERLAA